MGKTGLRRGSKGISSSTTNSSQRWSGKRHAFFLIAHRKFGQRKQQPRKQNGCGLKRGSTQSLPNTPYAGMLDINQFTQDHHGYHPHSMILNNHLMIPLTLPPSFPPTFSLSAAQQSFTSSQLLDPRHLQTSYFPSMNNHYQQSPVDQLMLAAHQQDKSINLMLPMMDGNHIPSTMATSGIAPQSLVTKARVDDGSAGGKDQQPVKTTRAPMDPKDSKVLGNPNARIMAKGAYLVSSGGLQKRSISIILPSGRKMYMMNYFKDEDKDK
jgi:hypothetical protein